MNLTKHKEERFLLKIEAQNQGVDYVREVKTINTTASILNFKEVINSL